MAEETKQWLKRLKLSESTISMILGALVVVVVGVLIFNYFSQVRETAEEIKPEEVVEEVTGEAKGLPQTHQVKGGEYLWEIARRYYQDPYQWPEIAQANNLTNPNLVVPGQELTIPKVEKKKTEASEGVGESITGNQYTVVKGDSLWFIALRAYGDPYRWTDIAQANNLVNPDLIHPGNEFVLPR